MAARIEGASDRLYLDESGVPASLTMCAWVYVDQERTYAYPLGFDDDAGNGWLLTGFGGTPGQIEFSATNGFLSSSSDMQEGGWYFAAATWQQSNNAAALYYAAEGDSTVVVGGTGTIQPFSTSQFNFSLGSDSVGEYMDGRVAYARVWSAVLSQSEIEAEMVSASPVRTADLWGAWALDGDTNDSSGNGRHLTETSTVTYVDGPSSFTALDDLTVFGTSAPAGTVTLYADGGGSLKTGNRFYTTIAGGISITGARVWNPAGADSTFLNTDVTVEAYLDDWVGANVLGSTTLGGTPVATKTHTYARVAGTWTNIEFDTPFTIPAISSDSGTPDLLSIVVQYAGGNYYVHVVGLDNLSIQSVDHNDVYQAEDSNMRKAINSLGDPNTGDILYGIDILFATGDTPSPTPTMYVGDAPVSAIYAGDTPVAAVYLGDDLVWRENQG